MKKIICSVFVVCCLGLSMILFVDLVQAAGDSSSPTYKKHMNTVRVNGVGKVSIEPDMAVMSVGVETQAKTTSEAQAQNNLMTRKVIDALKAQGVKEDDIKTQWYNIHPDYDYQKEDGRKLVGYVANHQLNIKIRNLKKVSGILDEVTKSGATNVGNVQYTLENRDMAYDMARIKAAADAKRKAQKLADVFDFTVGSLVQVEEFINDHFMPVERAMRVGGGGGSENIHPGDVEIQLTLNAMFILESEEIKVAMMEEAKTDVGAMVLAPPVPALASVPVLVTPLPTSPVPAPTQVLVPEKEKVLAFDKSMKESREDVKKVFTGDYEALEEEKPKEGNEKNEGMKESEPKVEEAEVSNESESVVEPEEEEAAVSVLEEEVFESAEEGEVLSVPETDMSPSSVEEKVALGEAEPEAEFEVEKDAVTVLIEEMIEATDLDVHVRDVKVVWNLKGKESLIDGKGFTYNGELGSAETSMDFQNINTLLQLKGFKSDEYNATSGSPTMDFRRVEKDGIACNVSKMDDMAKKMTGLDLRCGEIE